MCCCRAVPILYMASATAVVVDFVDRDLQASLSVVRSAYADDEPWPSRPTERARDPGLAPPPLAGLDPVELEVDGKRFRRHPSARLARHLRLRPGLAS
jgi:hypothetical protein